MKHKNYLLLIALCCAWLCLPITTNGQVKIGEGTQPEKGAVLDLKKTTAEGYLGGVLLPHVNITDLGYIPEDYTGVGTTPLIPVVAGKGVDTYLPLEGMVVYNTNSAVGTGAGIYVWSGTAWLSFHPCEPITGVSLDYDGSHASGTYNLGEAMTLTATITPIDATNVFYKWYKNGTEISGATNAAYSNSDIALTDGGTYKVEAYNYCGSMDDSKVVTVIDPCTGKAITVTNANTTYKEGAAISSINFTTGAGGANIIVTGLPAGITAANNNTNTVTLSGTPTTVANYTITATTRGGGDPVCTDDTKQIAVTVQINLALYTDDTTGNYKVEGKDCYDVAQSNFTTTCGNQSVRVGDFLNASRQWVAGKQFTYYFIVLNSAPFSNLQFYIEDTNTLISTQNKSGNNYIVTFDQSVLTKAAGTVSATALPLKVYALFEVGGVRKRVLLNVKVQDCVCGCGAFKTDGTWQAFMCHNLGANYEADPYTININLAGDYYQWGQKVPVRTGPNHSTAPNQQTGVYISSITSGNWLTNTKGPNDPCPSGFRVPSVAEWQDVINSPYNTKSSVGSWIENSYFSAVKIGPFLPLPTSGFILNPIIAAPMAIGTAVRAFCADEPLADPMRVYRVEGTQSGVVNYIAGLSPATIVAYPVRCIAE